MALARFGRAWYDDGPPRMADVNRLDLDAYKRLTARPRLYGFHATLKAPFRLAESMAQKALSNALTGIAARFQPIEMPSLKVALIGDFLALVPAQPTPQADALAAACAVELDQLRAPQTDAEYERRQPERLSERQRELLRSWGYPYVLEEFRWHMTLTDRLDNQLAGALLRHLDQVYRRACGNEPAVIDCLSLVRQPTLDTPFELVARIPLRPSELRITN